MPRFCECGCGGVMVICQRCGINLCSRQIRTVKGKNICKNAQTCDRNIENLKEHMHETT